jgi:hypothetical protein
MRLTRRGFFAGLGAAAIAPMLPNLGIWTIEPEWVPFTPTFTGFGTLTNVAVFSRKVGDMLEIKGEFTEWPTWRRSWRDYRCWTR